MSGKLFSTAALHGIKDGKSSIVNAIAEGNSDAIKAAKHEAGTGRGSDGSHRRGAV